MTTPAIYRFGPVFSHPCRAAKPRFRQSVVMVCLSAGSFLFGADRSLANYVIVGEAIFNDKNEKCDVVKLDLAVCIRQNPSQHGRTIRHGRRERT